MREEAKQVLEIIRERQQHPPEILPFVKNAQDGFIYGFGDQYADDHGEQEISEVDREDPEYPFDIEFYEEDLKTAFGSFFVDQQGARDQEGRHNEKSMHRKIPEIRWQVEIGKMMMDDEDAEAEKPPHTIKLR